MFNRLSCGPRHYTMATHSQQLLPWLRSHTAEISYLHATSCQARRPHTLASKLDAVIRQSCHVSGTFVPELTVSCLQILPNLPLTALMSPSSSKPSTELMSAWGTPGVCPAGSCSAAMSPFLYSLYTSESATFLLKATVHCAQGWQ